MIGKDSDTFNCCFLHSFFFFHSAMVGHDLMFKDNTWIQITQFVSDTRFLHVYLKFMDWQRIRLREAKLNKQYGTSWTLNSSRWFRLIPTHFSVKPSWDKVGQSFVMRLQCEVTLDADLPDSNFVHILGYMFSFPFRRNYDPKHDQCRQKLQI